MSGELQLFGGDPAKELAPQTALQSLHNGVHTGKRTQRIYTPEPVCARLRRFWPEGVELDPCHGPGSIVGARRIAFPEHPDLAMRDGLALDWPERTYCNPPFSDLERWVGHAARFSEVVFLAPWRSHRSWYQAALLSISACVLCDPVTFCGYGQTFPAPLALLYWGERAGAFALVFGDLGLPHIGPIGLKDDRQGVLFP